MLTDEQLVISCRQGDESAWETLVRKFERLIYAIPRRAGLDQEGAEDVFQQVFMLLAKNLHDIREPSLVQAWLVTTARRETLKIIKENSRRNRLPENEDEEDNVIESIADQNDLPDIVIQKLETAHKVRSAVMSLDGRCRELITMLFYQENVPAYSEIATELGIPEGSIGPTRARCLQKLLGLL